MEPIEWLGIGVVATVIEPSRRHGWHCCATPGHLKPKSAWPQAQVFGRAMRRPVFYEVGTLWECHECKKWWRCCDLPRNPPGGPYRGGGRRWRRVRWWHFADRHRINGRTQVFGWGGDLKANLMLPPKPKSWPTAPDGTLPEGLPKR